MAEFLDLLPWIVLGTFCVGAFSVSGVLALGMLALRFWPGPLPLPRAEDMDD